MLAWKVLIGGGRGEYAGRSLRARMRAARAAGHPCPTAQVFKVAGGVLPPDAENAARAAPHDVEAAAPPQERKEYDYGGES